MKMINSCINLSSLSIYVPNCCRHSVSSSALTPHTNNLHSLLLFIFPVRCDDCHLVPSSSQRSRFLFVYSNVIRRVNRSQHTYGFAGAVISRMLSHQVFSYAPEAEAVYECNCREYRSRIPIIPKPPWLREGILTSTAPANPELA